MQSAQTYKKKPFVRRYVEEDEGFWKKHISACSSSGFSKSAYCKQNKLNYARFIYWSHRLSEEQSPRQSQPEIKSLLPIQLIPENKVESHVLCTLLLKNGCQLQIHHQESLTHILTWCC